MDTDGPKFDQAARARIRRVLLAYSEQHTIGTPRLSGRISKANLNEPYVSYKTLQRFLAGDMRTNDLFVGWCAKFADGLPVLDRVGDLGRVMLNFYQGSQPRVLGEFSTMHSRPDGEFMPAQGFLKATPGDGFNRIEMRLETGYAILDGAMILSGCYDVALLSDRLTLLPVKLSLYSFNLTQVFMGCGLTTVYPFNISIERFE